MTAKPEPFQVTRENGAIRLTASEPLVARNIPAQRDQLQAVLQGHLGPVILDVSLVDMVDSLGITLIIRLYKSCLQKQIAFSVAGANAELLRLFKFFSLSDLFPVKER